MNDLTTTLDRLIARARRLHSLPAVAMEVLELTNNPRVDARALKECIENDPALTGKLLRVVNSSLFGLSREVSDLNQALALLGTKPLKLMVLGFSLPGGLFADVEREILGRYWRHTLTKAVAAREISETLFGISGDEAFIAGLLQDLGLLLLIQELGEPYVRFLDKVAAGGKNLIAMEVESMGFDHTALSAKLLAHWNLPESLVEAVAWENNGESSNGEPLDKPLRQILLLAELLARLLADGQPEALAKLLKLGLANHDFSEAQLDALVADLQAKVGQLADVLSLQLPESLDYRDILAQAHAQLAAVADEAAEDLLSEPNHEPPTPTEDTLLTEVQQLAEAVAKVSAQTEESATPLETAGAVQQPTTPPPSPLAEKPVGSSPDAKPAAVETETELLDQLSQMAITCRKALCPLSLLLVQFDFVEKLVEMHHAEGYRRLQESLKKLSEKSGHMRTVCVLHGKTSFALILPDCHRHAAVELGNELVWQLRRAEPSGGRRSLGVGAGVATVVLPTKSFLAENLLSAADRCLYGSYTSGTGVVKSIETY